MTTTRLYTLLLLTGVFLVACGVSPVPEPPDDLDPDSPELPGPVEWVGCPVCDAIGIRGEAGSVVDATTIWAVNLDRTEPPASAAVNEDGSFDLFIVATGGDELRIEAQNGALHSAPLELKLLDDESGFVAASRPYAECFVVPPELDFVDAVAGDSMQATVRLQHDCDTPVVIDGIGTHVESTAFSIAGPATPLTLDPGVNGTINVTFTAPDGFGAADFILEEAVVRIDIAGPERDRRSVHLHADVEP